VYIARTSCYGSMSVSLSCNVVPSHLTVIFFIPPATVASYLLTSYTMAWAIERFPLYLRNGVRYSRRYYTVQYILCHCQWLYDTIRYERTV